MEYIQNLEIDEALTLIDYAISQQEDELLFSRWIVEAQNHMSFDEFKEKLRPLKLRADEEILEDVFKILESVKGGD